MFIPPNVSTSTFLVSYNGIKANTEGVPNGERLLHNGERLLHNVLRIILSPAMVLTAQYATVSSGDCTIFINGFRELKVNHMPSNNISSEFV